MTSVGLPFASATGRTGCLVAVPNPPQPASSDNCLLPTSHAPFTGPTASSFFCHRHPLSLFRALSLHLATSASCINPPMHTTTQYTTEQDCTVQYSTGQDRTGQDGRLHERSTGRLSLQAWRAQAQAGKDEATSRG
ncbi:unnamed protein product [Protopolystoma xenopodis]|uniref:Uncharacterized protein n=1 Tax=Protopolystoma xenopodis TaxID=117903 RepID=A0A3S5AMV3_9PLAT|nr:unnamed protein product [Protopolystoma xenopodis]